MINILRLHSTLIGKLERMGERSFLGFSARVVFASVLLVYFFNSALTKVSPGLLGFLSPTSGAYAQILPPVAERASYDITQIAFFPYGLIVMLGTWAEFALPVLIFVGLFTRLASLAMLGFIFVMTYVDIRFHGLDTAAVGAPFDRFPDAVVADQRLLWLFPLIYIVLRGPGRLSFDALIARAIDSYRY